MTQLIGYIMGLQTTARGPNPAREAISSKNISKKSIYKKLVALVECNISETITLRKISGPRIIIQQLMWSSGDKVRRSWLHR